MASRLFTSQFNYTFEKQLVELVGSFSQTTQGVRATLAVGALTLHAVAFGAAGNSVTIALVDPGTLNHALVIAVSGNAITATLATNGSSVVTTTEAQLKAAIQGSAPATALVTVSGTGSSVITPAVAAPLAGGVTAVFSDNLPIPTMTLTQASEGVYNLTLADKYMALLAAPVGLISSSAADLQLQVASEAVSSTKIIVINAIAVGSGSPVLTSLSNGMSIMVDLKLRNVS